MTCLLLTAVLACVLAQSILAEDSPDTKRNLPPGLVVSQLTGNLVCPPVLINGQGVLLACDDRSVSLLRLDGRRLWRLELDRGIRGQLSALSSGMVLVTLSGGQLACVGLDGRLLWQRRLPGSENVSLFGTPDGRIVQIDAQGNAAILNPEGSLLFTVSSAKGLAGAPKANAEGVLIPRNDGGYELLDWVGNLIFYAKPNETAVEETSLQFRTENKADGSYAVRLRSNEAVLDFSSQGRIGHWLADHNSGVTLVWGDSLWRCFIFHPSSGDNPLSARQAEITIPEKPKPGPINPSLDLEAHYLQKLLDEEPNQGPAKVIDHIRRVIGQGKLAGRIYLYEDALQRVATERRGKQYLADGAQRVAAIGTLALFPSLRQLDWLLQAWRHERDAAVLGAAIGYFQALGVDPTGNISQFLAESLPIWQSAGLLPAIKTNFMLYSQKMGPRWQKNQGLLFGQYFK